MGLFDFFTGRRNKWGISSAVDAYLVSLDMAMELASPFIKDKIKNWDLDDRNLMLTLGYIAGHVDAAYQATRPSKYNWELVNTIFDARIAKYLSHIPGVQSYFAIGKAAARIGGGNTIGGMQGDPSFMQGTMAGGSDFVNLVNEKRVPFSLYTLLRD